MLICDLEKNAKERILVSIEEYRGHKFVDCRVYFEDGQGEWKPTKKGIALNAECIDEVIEGLQKASRKLEDALNSKTDTSVRKATEKHVESLEPILPMSEPVLNMLRTIGTGQSMSREDLQGMLKVCDKSLRRYISQALQGRYIRVEGRGPEQRIMVIGRPVRSDNPSCPEMSESPEAANWTGITAETVTRLA